MHSGSLGLAKKLRSTVAEMRHEAEIAGTNAQKPRTVDENTEALSQLVCLHCHLHCGRLGGQSNLPCHHASMIRKKAAATVSCNSSCSHG